MPLPGGNVPDPNNLPSFLFAGMATDTVVTTGGTFYDIATLGTVQPGYYLVSAQVVASVVTAINQITVKIWTGTTLYVNTEASGAISGVMNLIIPVFPLFIPTASVLKVSGTATGSAQTTFKAAAPDNGTGSTGLTSWISAVRIA